MAQLGVFRDDFYNAINVLPNAQYTATAQASGVLAASALAGAVENYITSSGATALTTDSAANIVNNLQTALLTKFNLQSGSAGNPPQGVPNLNNITFYVSIRNTNAGTLTLTAGAGVTITGTATLATTVERNYLVTVNAPNLVTFQDLGGAAVT